MPDSIQNPVPPQGPRNLAETLASSYEEILRAAVEVVSPGNTEADVLEVFPKSGEVRCEGEVIDLTPIQEASLREVVAQLGAGRRTDRTAEQIGISPGYDADIEGGLAWKVLAELKVAADAGTFIMAGSPHRQVGPGEVGFLSERGIPFAGGSEYKMVRSIVEAVPGFVKNEAGDAVLPFGYDIDNNHQLTQKPSGQFKLIGHLDGREVIWMRVDRENYIDEADGGKPKYRKQPDVRDRLRILSDIRAARGDNETPVVCVDSSTYQPSRDVDGVRVALLPQSKGRQFGVVTYGMDTLGNIKGESSAPPVLANVLGEIHRTAEQMAKLRLELARQQSGD